MTKYKIDAIKPTEMFEDSLDSGIRSDELTCEYCNREHLCPDAENDIENWTEQCENRYKENPDGVILYYHSDFVSGRYIDNKLFVIGCLCNGLGRYEQFIWNNRNTIRNYLKVRIEQEHEWAD